MGRGFGAAADGDLLGSAACRGADIGLVPGGTGIRAGHQGSHLEPSDGVRAFGAGVCGFGAGLGARHRGLCGVSEHKALLVGPPGLRGWERTAVPCVRALLGLPAGGNVVFSSRSCRSGRAEGLGVRGQAGLGTHTAPLCSLDEVLAGPWPGLAPLPPLRGGLGLHLDPVGTGWVPAASGAGCWGLSQAPILGLGAKRGRCWHSLSSAAGGTGRELPQCGTCWQPGTRAGGCEVLGEGSWERLRREVALGREVLSEHRGAAGLSTPFASVFHPGGAVLASPRAPCPPWGFGRARRGRQHPAADGLLSPPRAGAAEEELVTEPSCF